MLNIKHLLKFPEYKEVYSILKVAGKLGEKEGLEVMEAWGFKYKTNIIWNKVRKDGEPDGRRELRESWAD